MEGVLNALEEVIADRVVKGLYRVSVRLPLDKNLSVDDFITACEEKDLRCVKRREDVVDVWWDRPNSRYYDTDLINNETIYDLTDKSNDVAFRIP